MNAEKFIADSAGSLCSKPNRTSDMILKLVSSAFDHRSANRF